MLVFLRHFFTPHQTNNHRPKALHPKALIFYILFFALLQVNFSSFRLLTPNILGLATDINIEKLLDLTNQKRTEQGLLPLKLDPQLSQAAAGKAQDMFTKDYWAHNSPDGLTPWVFIRDAGYNYFYAGENLAKNFSDSYGVVNAWMASPSHRVNMLKSEYQEVGFAVVNGRLGGEETTLVVQMLGSRPKQEIAAKPIIQPTVAPSSATLTPTPAVEILPVAQKEASLAAAPLAPPNVFAAAKNKPKFNLFTVTKNTSLVLVFFLMIILVLDAFLIWRRKTVRLSGHNFAHFFFLITVVGAIWLINQGVIR